MNGFANSPLASRAGTSLLDFVASDEPDPPGGPRPDAVLIVSGICGALLLAGAVALGVDRGRTDERRGMTITATIGATAMLLPLLLALAGTDLYKPHNLIGALPPLLLVAAIGFGVEEGAARPCGRNRNLCAVHRHLDHRQCQPTNAAPRLARRGPRDRSNPNFPDHRRPVRRRKAADLLPRWPAVHRRRSGMRKRPSALCARTEQADQSAGSRIQGCVDKAIAANVHIASLRGVRSPLHGSSRPRRLERSHHCRGPGARSVTDIANGVLIARAFSSCSSPRSPLLAGSGFCAIGRTARHRLLLH